MIQIKVLFYQVDNDETGASDGRND